MVDAAAPRLEHRPALDGLRGVAVAGVLLFHGCAASGISGWFRGGNLGVSVFFTLSGYLISSLLLVEGRSSGTVALSRFWARRVQRLVPAASAVVLGVIVLGTVGILSVRASEVIATAWSATNWHAIHRGEPEVLATILGPLGPTWSLAVEEQAYLVLAVIAWVGARLGRTALALAVAAVAAVITSFVVAWLPRTSTLGIEFGTHARAGEIAMGVLLALATARWPGTVARRLASIGPFAAVALLTLFMVGDYTPPWLLRGGFLAVGCCSAAVIAAANLPSRLTRVLSSRGPVVVGRASYSLYLVHWPVMLVVDRDRTHLDGLWLLLVRLAATGIVAAVLHLVVEQPLRRRSPRPVVSLGGWFVSAAALTLLAVSVL